MKAGDGRVVVHPVAIKYLFQGDIDRWSDTALQRLEQRIGWRPLSRTPLVERVGKMAEALLATREVRFLGAAQSGALAERRDRLIQAVLEQSERRFEIQTDDSLSPIVRVRKLRTVALLGYSSAATHKNG